ncbi:DUF4833 domain-containing protein [Spirosoma endophyticum]|uniref:DUF4833 domain-containing protein n=1 Tax=Spirosoma endophyticum TaxID=662367 RepID=A0A1I1FP79_9BACT|nr:DUF4833 domain-containing protein [Spirosoma endophyticum]SFC00812.1 protein of unknown function [Spirosoma endophyticum]
MNTVRYFALLITLLLTDHLPAQAVRKSFPEPAPSPNQLFYLQRSKDINTVVYEANLSAGKKLNPDKPVQVYWIRYAEQGQREDLTSVQWQMAYGYTHRPLASDAYEISLNSFKQRPMQIITLRGKPMAMMTINGQRAYLQKVFVQLDPKSRLMPRVQYIEMFGTDTDKGKPVYERIIP